MRKAGAPRAATGENAVVVNCRSADIIVGPIGIVVADALLGEITPAMATAVCPEPCDAGAHPGEPLRKLYRGCAGAAHQRSGGRCGAEGESSLRRGRLRKKGLLKMPSACALGIFSGRIFYNRATADSLRAVRCCIFTKGDQEGNLICLCLIPAETAAQPENRRLLHCARSSEKASRKIPQDFRLASKKYKFLE